MEHPYEMDLSLYNFSSPSPNGNPYHKGRTLSMIPGVLRGCFLLVLLPRSEYQVATLGLREQHLDGKSIHVTGDDQRKYTKRTMPS